MYAIVLIYKLLHTLGPWNNSRSPGPPFTPTQGAYVELPNVMCRLEPKTDDLTEILDNVKLQLGKHDKDITQLKQTTYLYDDPTLQRIPMFYCNCNANTWQ